MFKSIAVTGPPGSGKSTLTTAIKQEMLKKYNQTWESYSVGDILREEHAEEMIEIHENDKTDFYTWFSRRSKEENIRTNEVLLDLVNAGKIRIPDSRFIHFYDSNETLKLWLGCNLDERVRRLVDNPKYKNMETSKIKYLLMKRENDEVKAAQEIWGEDFDFREPKYYHAILDSTDKTPEDLKTETMKYLSREKLVKDVVSLHLPSV